MILMQMSFNVHSTNVREDVDSDACGQTTLTLQPLPIELESQQNLHSSNG